jgi:hypothetical protein
LYHIFPEDDIAGRYEKPGTVLFLPEERAAKLLFRPAETGKNGGFAPKRREIRSIACSESVFSEGRAEKLSFCSPSFFTCIKSLSPVSENRGIAG